MGKIEPSICSLISVRRWFWSAGGRGNIRVGGVGPALIALLLVHGIAEELPSLLAQGPDLKLIVRTSSCARAACASPATSCALPRS